MIAKIDKLSKRYQNTLALDKLSFSLENGEVVALLGLNGAGKTTTLRLLAGFLAPSGGSILINNLDYIDSPVEIRKQIGYLPEHPAFYSHMRVSDFLRHMYRLRLATKSGEEEAVEQAIEKTQLEDYKDQLVGTLSAGYRKRVGLAQAIVHNPPLLILDEPISDLDPRQIVEIRNLIAELRKDHTILISSHILSEVSQMADRFLFIHKGELVAEEDKDSLQNKTGGYTYRIQVRNAAENLTANLQSLSAVHSVTAEEHESTLHLTVQANSDIRGELSRHVVEAGAELLQLNEHTHSLEDFFLQATENRDAA